MREALSRITILHSPGVEMLTEALARPVEAMGYAYDDYELVDEMVEEVAGEAACLPLLQYAAQRLWEGRDRSRRVLRREDYQAMGGVSGALARHADGVLSRLTSAEVNNARAILLRLVTPEGTRRILGREAALDGLEASAEQVLRQLLEARLISVKQSVDEDEVQLELAHESLVNTWGSLRRWIDEGREDLVFLAEVGQAAELWVRRGRQRAELWQGEALQDALRMLKRCTATVPAPA